MIMWPVHERSYTFCASAALKMLSLTEKMKKKKRSGEKAKNQRPKSNFLHDINFF